MVKENFDLKPLTYCKVGGKARFFLDVESYEELMQNKDFILSQKEIFVIGAGSNVLISDQGFDGLVLQVKNLNPPIEILGNSVRVCSGTRVQKVLNFSKETGFDFSFLAGIPGSMGGVLKMNAGTHLGEIKDAIESYVLLDLKTFEKKTVFGSEGFFYRKSPIEDQFLVLEMNLKVNQEDPKTIAKKIDEVLTRRKSSQPLDRPSFGSTFKNPKEKKAWEVLDQCGLRGFQIGEACFSEKHPNFILNLKNAKSSDVKKLIDLGIQRAKDLGIELIPEVCMVGNFSG